MLRIRCRECNTELVSHPSKTQGCGCANMTTVVGEKVTATDLGKVLIIDSDNTRKRKSLFSNEDLAWQEARSKRKVRKLDFEIR